MSEWVSAWVCRWRKMVSKVNPENNLWKEGGGKQPDTCICYRIKDIKLLAFLRDRVFKSSWNVFSSSSGWMDEGWLWRRTGRRLAVEEGCPMTISPPSPSELHGGRSCHFLTLLCPPPPGTPREAGRWLDEEGDQKPNHTFFKAQLLSVEWLIGTSDKNGNGKEIEQTRGGAERRQGGLQVGRE